MSAITDRASRASSRASASRHRAPCRFRATKSPTARHQAAEFDGPRSRIPSARRKPRMLHIRSPIAFLPSVATPAARWRSRVRGSCVAQERPVRAPSNRFGARRPCYEQVFWPADPSVSPPVCIAVGDQHYAVMASNGAGGTIIAWADHWGGCYFDVHVQRVDASDADSPNVLDRKSPRPETKLIL